jgi:hypothetical protein
MFSVQEQLEVIIYQYDVSFVGFIFYVLFKTMITLVSMIRRTLTPVSMSP